MRRGSALLRLAPQAADPGREGGDGGVRFTVLVCDRGRHLVRHELGALGLPDGAAADSSRRPYSSVTLRSNSHVPPSLTAREAGVQRVQPAM